MLAFSSYRASTFTFLFLEPRDEDISSEIVSVTMLLLATSCIVICSPSPFYADEFFEALLVRLGFSFGLNWS